MTTPAAPRPTGAVTVTDAEARKVAFGAFVGTALEWYDFFLYGTRASLVFKPVFFTSGSPAVATLARSRRSRWGSRPGRSARSCSATSATGSAAPLPDHHGDHDRAWSRA